ncbi:MAG: efflux RND transporter periplasmic adaptor subunit [Pseudomonadota bacterium]
MRIFPLLIAVLVVVVLYGVVFERDLLLSLARNGQTETGIETRTETPNAAPRTAGDTNGGERRVSVVALRSQEQRIDNAVVLRGRTEAARQVAVQAETTGLIVREPIRAGSFVEKGQIICEIDPGTRFETLAQAEARLAEARARLPEAQARVTEAEARLLEAQARVDEAEINYVAAVKLSEDGFASETRVKSATAARESAKAGLEAARSTLQAAKSGVAAAAAGIETARSGMQTAEVAVASAETDIARLTVEAPFSGLLETDTAELGSLLQPGSLCATVIQLNPMKMVGFVSETEVSRVAVGAVAGGRLASGHEVQGRVTFLSRSADETTRTFRVEIQVDNADLSIRDGQTAEIMIRSAGETAHRLPQSALTLNDEGLLGVRVVSDRGQAMFRTVDILRDTNEGVWVTGLAAQSDVIVVGQEFVSDGVAVDITYREAAQ